MLKIVDLSKLSIHYGCAVTNKGKSVRDALLFLFFYYSGVIPVNHKKYILECNNTPCNTGAHNSKMNEQHAINKIQQLDLEKGFYM